MKRIDFPYFLWFVKKGKRISESITKVICDAKNFCKFPMRKCEFFLCKFFCDAKKFPMSAMSR